MEKNNKLYENIFLETKLKNVLTEEEYQQFQEGKLKNALLGLSVLGASLGMVSCANISADVFDNIDEPGVESTVNPVEEKNLIKFIPRVDSSLVNTVITNLDKKVSSDVLLDAIEDMGGARAASSISKADIKNIKKSHTADSTVNGGETIIVSDSDSTQVVPGTTTKTSTTSTLDKLVQVLSSSPSVVLRVATRPDSVEQEGVFVEVGNSGIYLLVLGRYQISNEARAASSFTGNLRVKNSNDENPTIIIVDEDGDSLLKFNPVDIDDTEDKNFSCDTSLKEKGILIFN